MIRPSEAGASPVPGKRSRPSVPSCPASDSPGALSNLVVIGAQKCGTTALHSYLARHPEVSMSRPKELDFFVSDRFVKRRRGPKGLDWYRRHFDARRPVRGESSPNYTAEPIPPRRRRRARDPYYAGVARRMHALIPGAKLVYLVRDPIERVRAQWIHLRSRGLEPRPLESAIRRPSSTYLARSSYAFQLERFLELYPAEQILIVDQDDLLRRPHTTLRDVFRFLGVEESFWDASYERHVLQSRAMRRRTPLGMALRAGSPRGLWARIVDRPPFSRRLEQTPMGDELRAELSARLADDAARFRTLTGLRFEHWSL